MTRWGRNSRREPTNLVAKYDVILLSGEDNQVKRGVDHPYVGTQRVTSAKEGARQPVAHRSHPQSPVRCLFEAVRGIVVGRH